MSQHVEENRVINESKLKTATFAGGCFWCIEHAFKGYKGVVHVVCGFGGGKEPNPTYEQVCSGTTGHRESVQITYDPGKVSYEELVEHFWHQIDPTDEGGQFADRGFQYTSAIVYHDDGERRIAEESKRRLEESKIFDKPIVTKILPFTSFYPAEGYHQGYAEKHPMRYKLYASGSGRHKFIEEYWSDEKDQGFVKPSRDEIKKKLTPMQYHVTQEDGTESAFKNEYWEEKREGIYVDVVSGEPLFSSTDKFDSGTGWPSFTKPLEPDAIVKKIDFTLGIPRTEVRSAHVDSHLGHVFSDGPKPAGLRYCINSAALKFIPKKDLEKKGYGKYLGLFE